MACHMNKAPGLAQRLRLQSRLPPPGLHLSPETFRGTPWCLMFWIKRTPDEAKTERLGDLPKAKRCCRISLDDSLSYTYEVFLQLMLRLFSRKSPIMEEGHSRNQRERERERLCFIK
ncbi:unnamed protein product [Musa acuminata subsp. burmannicoides]